MNLDGEGIPTVPEVTTTVVTLHQAMMLIVIAEAIRGSTFIKPLPKWWTEQMGDHFQMWNDGILTAMAIITLSAQMRFSFYRQWT